MARVDATAAKAAAALAAAQLTTLLQDDTLTELFNDYKQAHHPMRNLESMFLLAPATGVVTANDAYIDAAYAGNYPNSGIESGRQSEGTPTPITLVSAAVADADPTIIVLTFSEKVFENQNNRIAVGGTVTTAKGISSIEVKGTVVNVIVDSAYISTDTILTTLRLFGNRGYIDLTDQAVTNNVA